MSRRSAGVLLIMIFLPFLFLQAQEKKTISLQEAINLGLKNSKQLKNSQARIEQATAALKESMEKRLPDAKVAGSYLWLSNPNIDIKSKGSNNNGNQGGTPKVSQAAYGLLNASLPVYEGGRVRYGIESSRFLAEATKLDADHDRQEVIQNTIEAYINLYKAKSSVSLVKENLAEAKQRVTDFTNLEANGLLPRNDLLKAELQASNIELSLLDAENNWKLANINMNLMLGIPEQTEIIPDSAFVKQSTDVKSVEEYIQSAFTQRKDLGSLELRKKAAETNVKMVRGEYYPAISLTGGYIAADVPGILSITNAVNVGAGVSYSISSLWKTKAKVQQAEALARQVEINESLLNDNIRLQVSQAYLNWLSTQKKIEVYEKAVEQATENYRIIRNKYNNNLATTTDLLDADVAQLQARMNLVFAKADAVAVYSKLLKEAGLLENNMN